MSTKPQNSGSGKRGGTHTGKPQLTGKGIGRKEQAGLVIKPAPKPPPRPKENKR